MRSPSRLLPLLFLAAALLLWPLAARPAQAQGSLTVRVDVVERSYLEVVVNGEPTFTGVLEAGAWREWFGRDIYMKIGNAAGVRITVDGQPQGTLGNPGQVVERRWTGGSSPSAPTAPPAASPTPAPPAPTPVASPSAPTPTAAPGAAQWYVVAEGDTLLGIANQFSVPVTEIQVANSIGPAETLRVGRVIAIPGADGSLPDERSRPRGGIPTPTPAERPGAFERMSPTAQFAAPNSPYYNSTWVSYYGRPGVAIMGILGEYPIDELVPILKQQAAAYDEANGERLGVTPVFQLVYGMATKAPGDDGSHLGFLSDEVVLEYVERAEQEGFHVVLDIQVGALSPVEAMARGFRWLEYPHVHLALDPEFAMSHPDQEIPGRPPGFVTAEQVNEVQRAMRDYLIDNEIGGRRVLVLHQFLDTMIQDKEQLEWLYLIDLTIVADGFGGPWPKVGKYNAFMDGRAKFTGFKLFYQWDEPLMSEREALGVDRVPEVFYIEVTPNFIIYQ